jgi:hypothetical protein
MVYPAADITTAFTELQKQSNNKKGKKEPIKRTCSFPTKEQKPKNSIKLTKHLHRGYLLAKEKD